MSTLIGSIKIYKVYKVYNVYTVSKVLNPVAGLRLGLGLGFKSLKTL